MPKFQTLVRNQSDKRIKIFWMIPRFPLYIYNSLLRVYIFYCEAPSIVYGCCSFPERIVSKCCYVKLWPTSTHQSNNIGSHHSGCGDRGGPTGLIFQTQLVVLVSWWMTSLFFQGCQLHGFLQREIFMCSMHEWDESRREYVFIRKKMTLFVPSCRNQLTPSCTIEC